MEESRMQQAVTSTVNALQQEATGTGGEQPTAGTVDRAAVEAIVAAWPATPRTVAGQMIARYGLPHEATPSRLIWFANGPWKRTIVYRDEVPHNFPKPHTDLLEQFIDYRVPPEKFADLAAFDGSVVPERTKGELSARCDLEEMNVLALNLAHDIVTGRRTVEDARQVYAETAMAFMMQRPAPYTEGLQFAVPRGGTADVDETVMGPMLGQVVEQAKDVVAGDEERHGSDATPGQATGTRGSGEPGPETVRVTAKELRDDAGRGTEKP